MYISSNLASLSISDDLQYHADMTIRCIRGYVYKAIFKPDVDPGRDIMIVIKFNLCKERFLTGCAYCIFYWHK